MCGQCGRVSVVSVRGWVDKESVKVVGDECFVYVGRGCNGWLGSCLGNRFVIGRDGDRGEVIRKYKVWLWGEWKKGKGEVWCEVMRLVELVESGEDVVLGCWCVPLACHGEVIRDLVLWVVRGRCG